MIDFRLASVPDPTAAQLADFKAFLAANGAESDAFLTAILKRAMLAVQAWDDRALLSGTATLVVSGREDNDPVRLYLTPGTIASVLDGDATPVAYSLAGKALYPARSVRDLVITYAVVPADDDLAALLPKVYRYASALYDGDESGALARILQEK